MYSFWHDPWKATKNFFSGNTDPNPYTETGNRQIKKMLNKQLLIEKQDQELSNNTLCELLSSAEMIAVMSSNNQIKRVFAAYDHFDTGVNKSISELKIELFTRIAVFNRSYKSYTRDHGEYKFPKNLSLQTINKYFNLWRKYIKEKDVNDCLIDIYRILTHKKIKPSYWFNKADEIDDEISLPTQERLIEEMKESAEIVPKVRERTEEICERVKKKYEENEKFEVIDELNGNPGDLKNIKQKKREKGYNRERSSSTTISNRMAICRDYKHLH